MFEDQQLAALLEDTILAPIDQATAPPTQRMRKIGGLISNQLSDGFVELEARFLHSCRGCVTCGHAPRADGRLMCEPCQAAQRPRRLTPAERQQVTLKSYEIARQRNALGRKSAFF